MRDTESLLYKYESTKAALKNVTTEENILRDMVSQNIINKDWCTPRIQRAVLLKECLVRQANQLRRAIAKK